MAVFRRFWFVFCNAVFALCVVFGVQDALAQDDAWCVSNVGANYTWDSTNEECICESPLVEDNGVCHTACTGNHIWDATLGACSCQSPYIEDGGICYTVIGSDNNWSTAGAANNYLTYNSQRGIFSVAPKDTAWCVDNVGANYTWDSTNNECSCESPYVLDGAVCHTACNTNYHWDATANNNAGGCVIDTYNIIYNNMTGATNFTDAPTTYTVESATITLGTPTKTGYTFDGWYDGETDGNLVTQIANGSTGNKTLWARWTQCNTSNGYEVVNNACTCVSPKVEHNGICHVACTNGTGWNGSACGACSTGQIAVDGQCVNGDFAVKITTTTENETFQFKMSAAGTFVVDCVGGSLASNVSGQVGSDGKTISRGTRLNQDTYTCTWSNVGPHVVLFVDGTPTGYSTSDTAAAIRFNIGGSSSDANAAKIASISGSLGAVFGTLESPTVGQSQPRFREAFRGASNMTGTDTDDPNNIDPNTNLPMKYAIPPTLFDGISGAPANGMFEYTFNGCSNLTGSIPATLFSGISGAPANSMFNSTFNGCRNLTGSIPATLFAGISGAPADFMFGHTFENCSNLTGSIPATLFSGISGAPANSMFNSTFAYCSNLTGSIPTTLFSGISGAPANGMFYSTFRGCSNLSGYIPPRLFAGISRNTTASYQMEGVFYNSGLATSCEPYNLDVYDTGFGTWFNGKVSCGPVNNPTNTNVTLYQNTSANDTNTNGSVTATFNSAFPSTAISAPTRSGYAFNGYYDRRDGGLKYYEPNMSPTEQVWLYTDAAAPVYAQWTELTSSNCQTVMGSGYYWNGSACTPKDTAWCVANVGDNYTWDSTNDECTCESPYEEDNGVCHTACTGNYTWNGSACACPSPYVEDNGVCHTACTSAQYWDANTTTCVAKDTAWCVANVGANYTWDGTNNVCACPSPYVEDNGICHVACTNGTGWNGNACGACPTGQIAVDGQCVNGKFAVKTTSLEANESFQFKMSAAGTFTVDCGDGGTLTSTANDVTNNNTITRGDTNEETYTCTWQNAGTHTVLFVDSTPTGYSTSVASAIRFNTTGIYYDTDTNAAKVAAIYGSLGAIFPTLNDGSNDLSKQPQFYQTFQNCSGLTELPEHLFVNANGDGISGAASSMFTSTFRGCSGLTELPEHLFVNANGDGISGAAQSMFAYTFSDCSGLTELPEHLFVNANGDGISGAAQSMFSYTFYGCTGLTSIPEHLFVNANGDGISGAAYGMFYATFQNCRGLTELPEHLFVNANGDGISGAAHTMFISTFQNCSGLTELPEHLFVNANGDGISGAADWMFYGTFQGCSGLTELPEQLFVNANGDGISGAASSMFTYTFQGCSNLTTVPANLFAGVSGTPKTHMFYQTFYNDTKLNTFDYGNGVTTNYIPPTFFGSIASTPTASNFMTDVFYNTGIATSCPSGTSPYTTGFESYWNYTNARTAPGQKVSCQLSCPANQYFNATTGTCDVKDTAWCVANVGDNYTWDGTNNVCTCQSPNVEINNVCYTSYNAYCESTSGNNYTWNGSACACQSPYEEHNGVCHTACTGNYTWNGSACACPSPYVEDNGVCHVACTNGTGWNGSECVACSTGQIAVDGQCVNGKFAVKTTPLAANGTFQFKMSAAGTFTVDCGDGGSLTSSQSGQIGADGKTITRGSRTDLDTYTCTWQNAGTHVVLFVDSTPRGYGTDSYTAAIRFNIGGSSSDANAAKIASIYGSLGGVFGTVANPTVGQSQPRFYYTFYGATNMIGTDIDDPNNIDPDTNLPMKYALPPTLFDGISGAPVSDMFNSTFSGCSNLTGSIPATLFSGISGAPANSMFEYTFGGCRNLTGSIPATLFNGISGKPADRMFFYTFYGCSGLTSTIPATLFSGISGAPASSMFSGTFRDCRNLSGSIPATLFSGISGKPASGMFNQTFMNCSNLTGSIPATLFSGISGAPANSMFNSTFAACSKLTGSIPATLFSGISGAPANYMFYDTFAGCDNLTGSIPATLFSGISGAPASSMFSGTFAACSKLTGYIPPRLFAGISRNTTADNQMSYVFYNSGLATSCNSYGLSPYTTGFESDFNGKVSCGPVNNPTNTNVTLYQNTSANDTNTNGSVTATFNSAFPSTAISAPTRSGYAFNGYYDRRDGGLKYYEPDMSPTTQVWLYTDAAAPVYAQWTELTSSNCQTVMGNGYYWNGSACTPKDTAWCVANVGDNYTWDGTNNVCACQSPYEEDNGVCHTACTGNYTWDGSACACPSPYVEDNGVCHTACTSAQYWDANTTTCVAKDTAWCVANVGANYTWDSTNDECTCESPYEEDNGVCHEDCGTGYTWDSVEGGCVCYGYEYDGICYTDADEYCENNYGTDHYWNGNVCSQKDDTWCVANVGANYTWDSTNDECTCESPYEEDNGVCHEDCGADYYWNTDEESEFYHTCQPIDDTWCEANVGANYTWDSENEECVCDGYDNGDTCWTDEQEYCENNYGADHYWDGGACSQKDDTWCENNYGADHYWDGGACSQKDDTWCENNYGADYYWDGSACVYDEPDCPAYSADSSGGVRVLSNGALAMEMGGFELSGACVTAVSYIQNPGTFLQTQNISDLSFDNNNVSMMYCVYNPETENYDYVCTQKAAICSASEASSLLEMDNYDLLQAYMTMLEISEPDESLLQYTLTSTDIYERCETSVDDCPANQYFDATTGTCVAKDTAWCEANVGANYTWDSENEECVCGGYEFDGTCWADEQEYCESADNDYGYWDTSEGEGICCAGDEHVENGECVPNEDSEQDCIDAGNTWSNTCNVCIEDEGCADGYDESTCNCVSASCDGYEGPDGTCWTDEQEYCENSGGFWEDEYCYDDADEYCAHYGVDTEWDSTAGECVAKCGGGYTRVNGRCIQSDTGCPEYSSNATNLSNSILMLYGYTVNGITVLERGGMGYDFNDDGNISENECINLLYSALGGNAPENEPYPNGAISVMYCRYNPTSGDYDGNCTTAVSVCTRNEASALIYDGTTLSLIPTFAQMANISNAELANPEALFAYTYPNIPLYARCSGTGCPTGYTAYDDDSICYQNCTNGASWDSTTHQCTGGNVTPTPTPTCPTLTTNTTMNGVPVRVVQYNNAPIALIPALATTYNGECVMPATTEMDGTTFMFYVINYTEFVDMLSNGTTPTSDIKFSPLLQICDSEMSQLASMSPSALLTWYQTTAESAESYVSYYLQRALSGGYMDENGIFTIVDSNGINNDALIAWAIIGTTEYRCPITCQAGQYLYHGDVYMVCETCQENDEYCCLTNEHTYTPEEIHSVDMFDAYCPENDDEYCQTVFGPGYEWDSDTGACVGDNDAYCEDEYGAGYRWDETNKVCTSNPFLETCPAGAFMNNGACISCAIGTNGAYTESDGGTGDINTCYKNCTVANASSVVGRDYYGNGVDTCEATACATGYHLTQPSVVTNQNPIIPIDPEDSGNDYGYISNDGNADSEVDTYGLEQNGTWAVSFDEGTVYGRASCQPSAPTDNQGFLYAYGNLDDLFNENMTLAQYKSGLAAIVGNTKADFVENLLMQMASGTKTEVQAFSEVMAMLGHDAGTRYTTSSTGQYCYCNMTGYQPSGDDKQDITSPNWWVVPYVYNSAQDCADGCASRCANNVAYDSSAGTAIRANMFDTVREVYPTCEADAQQPTCPTLTTNTTMNGVPVRVVQYNNVTIALIPALATTYNGECVMPAMFQTEGLRYIFYVINYTEFVDMLSNGTTPTSDIKFSPKLEVCDSEMSQLASMSPSALLTWYQTTLQSEGNAAALAFGAADMNANGTFTVADSNGASQVLLTWDLSISQRCPVTCHVGEYLYSMDFEYTCNTCNEDSSCCLTNDHTYLASEYHNVGDGQASCPVNDTTYCQNVFGPSYYWDASANDGAGDCIPKDTEWCESVMGTGYYWDETANDGDGACVLAPCPAGSYMDNDSCATCASGTNNEYTLSDGGFGDINTCYRACNIANASETSGHDFYGTGGNTCQPTACSTGYRLETNMSFANLIVNGTTSGMSVPDDYTWSVNYPGKGTASGQAICDTQSGNNIGARSDTLSGETGTNCWCKFDTFTQQGSAYSMPLTSAWVLGDKGDPYCEYSCSWTCAYTAATTNQTSADSIAQGVSNTFNICVEDPRYSIYYYYNYSDNGSYTEDTYSISETPVTLVADPIVKAWHTFGGWYDNPELTGEAITTIPEGSTGDKTFYAKWVPDVFEITYHTNEGTNNPDNPTSFTYGQENVVIYDPTREGYTFGGWYNNSALTGTVITQIPVNASPDLYQDLYAKWILECSANQLEIDNTCYSGKFAVKTTSLDANDTTFQFKMSAAGTFTVDCVGGTLTSSADPTDVTNNNTITRSGTDETTYTCTWEDAGEHVITFSGAARQYSTTWNGSAIRFSLYDSGTDTNAEKIASVYGSLYSVFPTLNDGSANRSYQPKFYKTFYGATNLLHVPATLFSGAKGAAESMFRHTFDNSGLLDIPPTLFNDVSGAATNMFNATFLNCTGLTSVPSGLFDKVTVAAEGLFYATFQNCDNLTTVPADLFSRLSGNPISYMLHHTFYNDTKLDTFSWGNDVTTSYIPPQFFGSITTPLNTSNVANDIFYNTGVAVSCPANTYQYISGFESYWNYTDATTSPGQKVSCTPCPTGQTSPAGSTSVSQCVVSSCPADYFVPVDHPEMCFPHILHIGENIVYLKADKLTTPSINIRIGDDVFYANMATSPTYMNSQHAHYLKMMHNNTLYYVCDDTTYEKPEYAGPDAVGGNTNPDTPEPDTPDVPGDKQSCDDAGGTWINESCVFNNP